MSTPTTASVPLLSLIDSSIWIPVLRRTHPAAPPLRTRIAELQGDGTAATTEPVVLELLRGARDDANYQRLDVELRALPCLTMTSERWQVAAELAYRLRRQHGMTFPTNDLLIASVAMAHGATLVHRDGDFDLIARHTPLRVESHVRPAGDTDSETDSPAGTLPSR